MALSHRDQRLPRHAAARLASPDGDALLRRGAVAPAVPGPAAGRDRAERRRAGRGGRRTGDDRARVPRGRAGPAAATAGGADRPRRARLAGQRDGVRCSRPPWRPPTARSSGRARRCRSTCRRGARTGPPESRAPRSARCSRGSSTRTNAATPRPPSRSRRRTSGSRCRPTRCASTGSRPSRRCSSARSERTGTATGAWCRRGPTGCRPPPATSAGPATPSSGRSSSTSCGSRTAVIAEITTFGARAVPRVRPSGGALRTVSPSGRRRRGVPARGPAAAGS